jgi:sugar phosphate isomerase/epimerase
MKRLFLSILTLIEEIEEMVDLSKLDLEVANFVQRFHNETDEEIIEHVKRYYPHIESLHGPFYDLDFASSDQAMLEHTYETYHRMHQNALTLNCRRMVIHSSYSSESCAKDLLKVAIPFWKWFLEEHKGVTYYIENIFDPDYEYVKALYDGVNHSDLQLCLDVGHANKCSDLDIAEWVMELGSRIGHVHLHNNYGDQDSHFGLHRGSVPMDSVLEVLVAKAPLATWCIETIEIIESIEYLQSLGYYQDIEELIWKKNEN